MEHSLKKPFLCHDSPLLFNDSANRSVKASTTSYSYAAPIFSESFLHSVVQ